MPRSTGNELQPSLMMMQVGIVSAYWAMDAAVNRLGGKCRQAVVSMDVTLAELGSKQRDISIRSLLKSVIVDSFNIVNV